MGERADPGQRPDQGEVGGVSGSSSPWREGRRRSHGWGSRMPNASALTTARCGRLPSGGRADARPMTAYLLKRLAIGLADAGRRVDGGVRRAGGPARRPGPADARHERHAEERSRCCASRWASTSRLLVRYLDWAGGLLTLDFGNSYTYSVPVIDLVAERVVVSLPLALMALVLSTAIAIPVGVFAAQRRGRAGRHAGDGRRAGRRRHAEFLVRADADLHLRRLAAAGAGRRLSRLERGRLAGAEGADPARDRARSAAGGDPRPRHPLGAARSAGRGLYPHRPRQGPAAPRGAVAARAAQRA